MRRWLAGRMLFKIVYLLTRLILGLAAPMSRRDLAKDAELLVLRHENAVLRRATCRTGDLRRNQRVGGCRCGLPLAERLRQVTSRQAGARTARIPTRGVRDELA
jgi:hypothetical protein